ncbi:MAG: hypothetical protein DRP82_02020 [Planctomycetota bacterium]|nr:MAG: hypothetical protein DRP82_02020 [Planctomycetota bacterium]
MIERVIRAAKAVGAKNFVIVTGYRADDIKHHLGNGSKLGVSISYAHNQNWEKAENGVSVLAAEHLLKGKTFLLLMADHLVSEGIVARVAAASLSEAACALGVDFRPKNVDLDDATKVEVQNGKITGIGKGLSRYDGVDTGVFKATSALFEALRTAVKQGDSTLSGGIRVLTQKEGVAAVDVTNSLWCDLDTPADWRRAQRLLLSSLKKPTDGPVSRLFNRPLSTRITSLLVRLPLTPNGLTLISFLLSLVSAAFFACWGRLGSLLGGITAQVASVLDGCDGEVARLKYMETEYGGWMDAVLDRYGDAAIFAAIAANIQTIAPHPTALPLAFAAAVGSILNAYTAIKHDSLFRSRMRFRFGRDVRMFLVMVAGVIAFFVPSSLLLFLAFIAILTNTVNIVRLIRHAYHSRTSPQ